ncbi:RDD family protein [Flavobacterium sp.]|uniref:RDD family protein n=1 Tax=Flavobacterium sp. TaxID=239 RepID=UPI0028BE771C|nr:RDD family protein [Flavobacterium sp.]
MENKTFRVTSDLWATQGQRFGNYIIDLVIQYALLFLFGVLLAVIATAIGNTDILEWLGNIPTIQSYAIGYLVMLLYYASTEIFLSRSIAKYITQTVVVDQFGEKPDSSTIAKRTLCRMIPFNHFSFLGGGARGWHDSISDTYVVQKKVFEEKKRLFYSFDEIGQREE